MNQTIFQFFHWYYPTEHNLWNHCGNQAAHLKELGVTHVWLPPAYKSQKGSDEPGYAVYDLYDLGEFDQKGSIRTKHGTRDEYLSCIQKLKEQNIHVLADVVFNHKFGGDHNEFVPVVEVSEKNRKIKISREHIVEARTHFSFPGRNKKYSSFEWNWKCFTGFFHDDKIKLVQSEFTRNRWEQLQDKQHGSFDFLMANDIEFRNPAIRQELMRWGIWYLRTTGVEGFRLDGLKHIAPDFFCAWLDCMQVSFDKNFFAMGEYWKNDVDELTTYLDTVSHRIRLVDVPLHFNLHEASVRRSYDLRDVLSNTLVARAPQSAIIFVDNHDTQPLQAIESSIQPWFKPQAYALMLLRKEGVPCVFYPAIYGADYIDTDKQGKQVAVKLPPLPVVDKMMRLRATRLNGEQRDYFENKHVIGWTIEGNMNDPASGFAVIISNGKAGKIKMSMGEGNAHATFCDSTGNCTSTVQLDKKGEGVFPVNEKSISIWQHVSA
jgi:alpha-amylase